MITMVIVMIMRIIYSDYDSDGDDYDEDVDWSDVGCAR